ncbi:MAG: hypothetical protein H6643_02125 [Caldilineaceae bacterium]|nr:hypothetical protein [Caldilineaceae bacterium]
MVFIRLVGWQVGNFNTNIADAFDWEGPGIRGGPAACTGMPVALLVA